MIRTRATAILFFVSALFAAGCAARTPTAATPAIVQVQLLGFNDFHGTLDPPTGSNGRIGEVTAGGAAFFRANGLERLFRDAQGARFHPLQEGLQKTLTARVALGLEV